MQNAAPPNRPPDTPHQIVSELELVALFTTIPTGGSSGAITSA
jgi:hypothetical protein